MREDGQRDTRLRYDKQQSAVFGNDKHGLRPERAA